MVVVVAEVGSDCGQRKRKESENDDDEEDKEEIDAVMMKNLARNVQKAKKAIHLFKGEKKKKKRAFADTPGR